MTGWAQTKQNISSGISLGQESDTHTLLVKLIDQLEASGLSGPTAQPGNTGLTSLPSQATTLPHAFNAVTLHDLTSGA
ncbi:hypothetical protein Tco_0920675 [Tanacetum coccineum]